MSENYRYGVLLVNTGTPDEPTPEAVKEYLAKFLMDDRIVPMNKAAWWMILHCFILPKRKHASAKKYQMIWTPEGSTFEITHAAIERKLNAYFKAAGVPALVACGMSYGKPTVMQAMQRLQDAGVEKLVVLPLYPQSAFSTTGSVSDAVERSLAKMAWDIPHVVIDNYAEDDGYIHAMTNAIKAAGFGQQEGDRIIFSFHSIPLIDIEHGDTYPDQTRASCSLIAQGLGISDDQWAMGYQCQFDKGREWLHPFSRETLHVWAEQNTGRVFMICPNFVSDCLETLYDVGCELKPFYMEELQSFGHEAVDENFVYVPCLNDSDEHIRVLGNVISAHFA